ncbi:MAG: hypothetical protein LBS57_07510 [Treponema sp.]|jgi:hypothetical protein|nr:hypothetical protein [Treponema sp.]
MTKHERALEFARDFKRQVAIKCAKRIREEKKKAFEDVMVKGKVVTYGDLFAVLGKLSKKAKEYAALNRIQTLAGMGYSPTEIIELMEPKRPPRKENAHD